MNVNDERTIEVIVQILGGGGGGSGGKGPVGGVRVDVNK